MAYIWNDSSSKLSMAMQAPHMTKLPLHMDLQRSAIPAPSVFNLQQQQQPQLPSINKPQQHLVAAGLMNVAEIHNNNYNNLQQQHYQLGSPALQGQPQKAIRKAPYRNPTQREIHIISERQRREEMNDKFAALRSILPKFAKKDKASIITHTIKYLGELEETIRSLRSRKSKRQKCSSADANGAHSKGISPTTGLNKRCIQIGWPQPCGKLEAQDLGSYVLLKLEYTWSSRLLLQCSAALQRCGGEVVQCLMTKHAANATCYFTIHLDRSICNSIDTLVAYLQNNFSSVSSSFK